MIICIIDKRKDGCIIETKSKVNIKEKTRKKYDVADVFRKIERQEGKHAYAD